MIINEIVYKIGIIYQNNYIYKNLKFLNETQTWDIDRLRNHQFARLKKLLNNAYSKTVYYRELFDRSSIHPDDIKSMSDLQKIPLLTKDAILQNVDKIQINKYPEKLIYSETSGSTGKPLVFYRNQDWDAMVRASVFRGYSWYGIKPWDRNGYLWGYNFALKRRLKTMVLDTLQNRFRLFSYKDAEINRFIKKLEKADFLGGYSSMIYEIAKKVNRNKNKHQFHLKMIKGTSEKIFDTYQDEVKAAFGKKMISEYGSAEAGIIAFECPKGNMHINMETVIVEEIDNEIVITNLYSMSFPIIRYKLGDYVVLDHATTCGCGMKHPIIKEVTGRVGRVIYGIKDTYPSLTLYYVFKNLAIEHHLVLNYQVVQEEKGTLNVYIENELSLEKRQLLTKEFIKYFDSDVNLSIFDKANLISTTKKKKDFISNL